MGGGEGVLSNHLALMKDPGTEVRYLLMEDLGVGILDDSVVEKPAKPSVSVVLLPAALIW